jgi:CBS domain-containing protein
MVATITNSHRNDVLARPAREIMTAEVVSIAETAPLREAMAMLIDLGFSGAPVVNEVGQPIGVISQSDILVHDRNGVAFTNRMPDYYQHADLTAALGEPSRGIPPEAADCTSVSDVMTPIVFAVRPEALTREVVEEMLRLRVHRLFVIDGDGALIGIIAMSDILRHLLD